MKIIKNDNVGEKTFKEHQAVLIGLSIRNSYFKEKSLLQILQWSAENFKQVFIMCPDVPAISTLQSLGYDYQEAKEKAALASNNLENKCNRIITQLEIKEQARFLRWNQL